MPRSRKIILAVGMGLILGAQCVFTILLSVPDGIRIHSPEGKLALDRSFVVSGDAWARKGLRDVRVEAVPADEHGTRLLTFPARRDAVRSRGVTVSLLSSWSVKIELPADGAWNLRAVATGSEGRETATPPRQLTVQTGTPPREFRSWTTAHIVPMILIVVLSVGLGLLTRGRGRRELGSPVGPLFPPAAVALTAAVWVNEFIYQVYWFFTGGWSVTSALMLQMCGLSILFIPVMLFSESPRTRQLMFDVLYFWGIGGAIQALIAPDIGSNGFPAFRYFSFFVSHGLIIISTMTMALAGRVTITLGSLVRAAIVTNILLVPMYGIDQAIALLPPYDPGNYFVLGYPPPTGSVVDVFADVFGPSPRYVVGLELMGLAVFLALYAPWPLARLFARRAHPPARAESRRLPR